MRIFVTGASGFVGPHLRAHAVASGDVDTTPAARVDVTDARSLIRALGDAQPEVVYHLAAYASVAASWQDATTCTRVNVVGTSTVLEAARTVAPTARIVVVSSSEVYGQVAPERLPIDEHFVLAPSNPYATSKVEAEHVAHDAVRRFGQNVILVRPFSHIGPGQRTTYVVPALAQRLWRAREAREPTITVGNLTVRRDLADVRDVVRAYRLAAQFATTGEVYNVATGQDVSLLTVAEELRERLYPGCGFEVDPALLRPTDVTAVRGSAQKLHDVTGWEPRVPLTTSLDDIIEDLGYGVR